MIDGTLESDAGRAGRWRAHLSERIAQAAPAKQMGRRSIGRSESITSR
jgi:hypothetical protein